jgi:CheY-like chemotaxis protein
MEVNLKRILVVEDELELRLFYIRCLTGAGYSVTAVSNTHDALRILTQNEPFFAVLTDFNMPGGNGDEFIRSLRQNRTDIKKIVLASGQLYQADCVRRVLSKYQPIQYLEKPFGSRALLSAMEVVIEHEYREPKLD